MREAFDGVVVVGCGPVGLVLALKLAQAGHPVLILNDAAGIDASPRAIVYHSPVVEALSAMGLLPDLKAIGVLKQSTEWRQVDGTLLAAVSLSVLHPEDTPFPFNLHLGQHLLGAVVLDHLRRLPNTEVRWNHKVVSVANKGTKAEVEVETEEGRRTITAPWIVGTDGASSTVRRSLGLGFPGTTWPEWFVATDLPYDFAAHGYAKTVFIVDPDHWGVIVQIDEHGLFRLTYGEPPETEAGLLRDGLAAKYRAILPSGEAPEPLKFSPYRVHERCADTFRSGRVLLAGDAAHAVNPIGGLGLSGGILDAVALGEALAAVLDGAVGEAVLDRYAEERRRVFLEFTAPAARENKRRLSERDPERQALDRERLARMHNDPVVQREALLRSRNLLGNPILI